VAADTPGRQARTKSQQFSRVPGPCKADPPRARFPKSAGGTPAAPRNRCDRTRGGTRTPRRNGGFPSPPANPRRHPADSALAGWDEYAGSRLPGSLVRDSGLAGSRLPSRPRLFRLKAQELKAYSSFRFPSCIDPADAPLAGTDSRGSGGENGILAPGMSVAPGPAAFVECRRREGEPPQLSRFSRASYIRHSGFLVPTCPRRRLA